MKKLLAMVLAVVMVMGCLTGCGEKVDPTDAPKGTEASKTTDAPKGTEAPGADVKSDWLGTEDGKTITLSFWGGLAPDYGYDKMVENFNAEYKDRGLQIEYTRYVNDSDGNLQLETQVMSGTVDVFMGYGGRTVLDKRVEANLVLEISDELAARNFDVYEELGAGAMANFTYDNGAVYGFPTKYENARWLLINVDMFNAAGVEIPYDGWSYSEFLDAVEKLTTGEGQDKVYGVSWTLDYSQTGVKGIVGSVLGAYNMYKDDAATAVNYDHPVYKQGLEMVNATLQNGWAIPIEDEVSEKLTPMNAFILGKCAISTNIASWTACMDKVTYPHEFTTALVPGPVPDGAEYESEFYRTHAVVAGAGDLICVAGKTEYVEQSVEFVQWYLQGGMAPLAQRGRIPLWTGLDKAVITNQIKENAAGTIDERSMNEYLSIDSTMGQKSVTGSIDSQLNTIWKEEFEAMCYGRQSVDETVANMTSRCNELLANGK